jgi:hypothetical protein
MRRLVLASFAIAVVVLALAPASGAATANLPLKKGDLAGSFGIGHGRTMYLECHGKGAPTVILDSGLRNGAGVWNLRTEDSAPGPTVLPSVARFTRVCAYDRPGTINTFSPSASAAAPRCRCRGRRPTRSPTCTHC